MAEVGVLSLQIHDNSEKAASGLNKLASALERVRGAVGGGKQLSGAAKEIEKINSAVSGATSGNASKSLGDIAKKVDAAKQAASGFVDVSSKIEETMSSVGGAMADATKSVNTYTDSIKEAKKAAETTGKTVKDSWSRFNPETGEYDPMPGIKSVSDLIEAEKKAHEASVRIDNIRNQIADLRYGLENPVKINFGDFIKQTMNIEGPVKSAKESMDVFLQAFENMEGMTETEARIAELNPELQDLATNGESSRTVIQRMKEAFFGADSEVNSFGGAVRALLPSLSSMSKQLVSIARRMALRAIIKQVTAGFKEGVENLYWYSNAVGTDFAPAMDSAASAMLQFKNSIGAAAAPVIQAMIPVLQTVVNWFITAINYANQFLALITGRSGWTRALPIAADAFEQTGRRARSAGSSAREAAKDIKELLADWDELNIIQSETGGGTGSGGGGGGSAGGVSAEYASMFQEMRGFNEDIQAFARNLTNSFGSVLELVKKVGAAMLAWKVSSAFSGIVGTLAGLVGTYVALDLVVRMTGMFDNTFLDTGHEGWLIGSLLTPIIGGIFTKQILDAVVGGNVGKLAIPLMLTLSSIVDIVTLAGRTDVDALDRKSLETIVVSALKMGGAAAYFAYMLGGYTLGGSLLGGTAVAIATFGVAIGIKAIAQVADSGVTMENIKAAALASLAVGIGAGMFAKIAGASMLSAAAFGLGAAVFTVATLAVGIGIAAIINANKDVKWGKQKLTAEQIESFVNSEMFSIDVKTTAKIITDKVVTPSAEERAQLETNLTNMLGDWKIIQLGIAGTEDYENLQSDVDAVVASIQSCIKTAKDAGKLTIQFIPTLAGETEEEQASWLTSYSNGWTKVDEFATTTGKRIGELISNAENNALKEGEPELLKTLMDQMSRVASAVARGKASSEAFGNMLFGIGDIDQASFDQIVSKYADYQNELRTSLMALANEQLAHQGSLVAALYEIDPNSKEYQDAVAKYRWMSEHLMESVEDGVREYSGPGREWLTNFLREKFVNPISKVEEQLGMGTFGGDLAYLAESRANGEIDGNRAMADEIDRVIRAQIGFVNDDLAKYLEKTGLESWNVLTESTKASIRAAMEAALGDKELVDEIIKMWEVSNPVEEAINEAEEPEVETAATVEATVKENVTYEPGSESVDAGKDATGNLPESVGQELASTDDVISTHTFPKTNPADTSATTDSFKQMRDEAVSYMNDVIVAANKMDSILGGYGYNGIGGAGRPSSVTGVKVYSRATGGNIRSGELFFGNENGKIEMMGKMGNSAVVANNQQIVEGISKGVAASNSGMESAMNMMVTLMRQFVSKEFTARVVPSSGMGRNNVMSGDAYRKVTG